MCTDRTKNFRVDYRRRWRRTVSEMAGAIDEPLSHQTTPFQWTPSDPSVDDGADSKSIDEIRRPLRINCRQGKRSPTSDRALTSLISHLNLSMLKLKSNLPRPSASCDLVADRTRAIDTACTQTQSGSTCNSSDIIRVVKASMHQPMDGYNKLILIRRSHNIIHRLDEL